ncbi:MAG: glycine zipper 2TM domain-containing protein [Magnetovibrio sp.]|nr:glycine zipper 2TM domain-containing protein [Magnetovibrio sp.]
MVMALKPVNTCSTLVRGVLAAALLVGVSACSWNDNRTETMGAVVGGLVGGIIGSKMGKGTGRNVAIVIGATLGAMWGRDIAKEMTSTDKHFSKRTTEDTLEYGKPGQTVSWSNPDSGNSGSITPDQVYANDKGENCRQFETTVSVEGEDRTATGTACKSSDGQWQVIDEPELVT